LHQVGFSLHDCIDMKVNKT